MSTQRFFLSKYTPKDQSSRKLRPCLTGIYHDSGYKVVSDGHIMCVVKSKYPSEYEGKIVKRKGIFVDDVYPQWRKVIPPTLSKESVNLDIEDLRKRTINGLKEAEETYMMVFVKIEANGNTMYYEGKRFKLFLDFISAFPESNLSIKNSNNFTIKAETPNGDICILLSIKYESDTDFQTVV